MTRPKTPAPSDCKVSIVDFLNAAPLGWGFEQGYFREGFQVTRDTPAACARKLGNGEADVGLIPSIAYQTIPGLTVLPDLCIAADGDVRSVLLLSRHRRLGALRRIAADPASRTSAALLRILLAEWHGVVPEMTERAGDPRRLLDNFDAVLAIGDRALVAPKRGLTSFDLAGEWKRRTGLPFVFAFWAVRDGVRLGEGARAFALSLALGRGNLDAIVSSAARKVRLPVAEMNAYFRERLVYDLGERERKGLDLFFRLARAQGVIDRVAPLRFHAS
ncbi:MAG: menaquinone biosynthesis protein [Acidobacteriota bacterium]